MVFGADVKWVPYQKVIEKRETNLWIYHSVYVLAFSYGHKFMSSDQNSVFGLHL